MPNLTSTVAGSTAPMPVTSLPVTGGVNVSPITNPTQVNPTVLGQEMYQALVAAYAPQNAALLAGAPAGTTVALNVPILSAIQLVEALSNMGVQPTAAQLDAQVVQVSVPSPKSNPPVPPPYVLGPQIASNPSKYILDSNGAFPAVDTEIQINGLTYMVGALDPFVFTAEQVS